MKKLTMILAALALTLAGLTAAQAGIPAGKETIKIDLIPGDKGAVEFPHAKHATELKVDGKALTCKSCHHKAPEDGTGAQACSACHVKPGEALKDGAPALAEVKDGKADRKSVIFHQTCVECHKKVTEKKISSCKACHK